MYQIFGNPGYLYLQFWTHKIGGLHQNDFIMAAKTDELYQQQEAMNGRILVSSKYYGMRSVEGLVSDLHLIL